MVYFKILFTKSISNIPDPPQVDVGARRADVPVLILSLRCRAYDVGYRTIAIFRILRRYVDAPLERGEASRCSGADSLSGFSQGRCR